MDGLLLRLLDDKHGTPGRWFWPCFEPLRAEFARHHWIVALRPWGACPDDFDEDRETADYDGCGNTETVLWRPGAVARWADRFQEEFLHLWAVDPAEDPARIAAQFNRLQYQRGDSYSDRYAVIRLIYTDSTCWEIFARNASLLRTIENHVQASPSIRAVKSSSTDRRRAFADVGLEEVWRALYPSKG